MEREGGREGWMGRVREEGGGREGEKGEVEREGGMREKVLPSCKCCGHCG